FKDLVEKRISKRNHREFGFEYELIADKPLSREYLERIKNALPSLGFHKRNGQIICDQGMYITFEPGGQLEFSSPPMGADEIDVFDFLLKIIDRTVAGISVKTSVNYLPVPFIPDRGNAPMLLEAKRYHDLHTLLGSISDRGREMMKGTAAIHLHVSLINFDELLRIWSFMCALSREENFAMGEERRDIWSKTDPSRCGLRCTRSEDILTSELLFEKLICFALFALELNSGIPFGSIRPGPSFEEFLVHFTTIFTDVRLNTKGMTLELRTLDSRPLHMFRETWITFLDMVQQVMDDKFQL
ncbi:MAG: hypothetical protein KAH31_11300, partial [Candidatus Sabulitectum sp.]|nr:hypothetical protein [Candidatus Sabulitectum sp.]